MKTRALCLLVAVAVLVVAVPAAADTVATSQSAAEIRELRQSGDWGRSIARQAKRAKAYLARRTASRKAPRKPALVLDIDETSLDNYPCLARDGGIPYDPGVYAGCVVSYDAPAIKAVRALYRRAKRLGVAVFFITARPEQLRDGTLRNLRSAGYGGKFELILEPAGYERDSAVPYKSGARRRIQRRGFKILANVGDQRSDLKGGYAERTYKLPNPVYFTS